MKNFKARKRKELMEWAETMPVGWVDAFAEDMVDELMDILFEERLLDSYQILDVRNKLGGLRWYAGGFEGSVPKSYWVWLDKYEDLSMYTCVVCGAGIGEIGCNFSVPVCDKCQM